MMFLKLLLNMRLIFVIATALTVNSESSKDSSIVIERLSDNILPMHYDIKFRLHINRDIYKFDGECSINLYINNATQNITLHSTNLRLIEAETSLVDEEKVIIKPLSHVYNGLTGIVVIYFNNPLSSGQYILNMKYEGIINSETSYGISKQSYKDEKGQERWLVVTHFQPTFARRAFPCFDEPALKSRFNISIRHHGNYTALSNMPAYDLLQDSSEDGMFWTKFQMTPVMSTYLVAFVVADYVRVSNENGKINVWCRLQVAPYVKLAMEFAETSSVIMSDYTKFPEVMPKMDHVVISHYPSGAMENWGLIIYRESHILYDEESDDRNRRFLVEKTVAHEMAHQWFGNLVSPKWWSYLWLSEGLASFFEYHMQIVGYWRAMNHLAGNVQNYAFEVDIGYLQPVTHEIPLGDLITTPKHKAFSAAVYQKGSSASPDDLWNEMQIALDKSNIPHDAYRLKDVMDTWMNQKRYPVVTVYRNYDTGDAYIRQECFRPFLQNVYEEKKYKWWIPISFTTQTNFNFSNTVPTHWLRPQDSVITINGIYSEAWLIVNLQRTGYYLVNYDPWNWKMIADYLNSDEYINIHPLNRAQIIFDAFHLMRTTELRVSIFMNIVKYFERELNHIPWYSIFDIIEYLHKVSKYSGNLYFKHELLNALDNVILHIGYEEEIIAEEDLTKLTRATVLKWACIFGNNECTKRATDKLIDHLIDPNMKISPDLKQWVYCGGMMKANRTIWNKLLDEYVKKPRPEILYYLSCSENPDIIINYLYLALSNQSLISGEMCKQIYEYVSARHADNDAVLDYILITFDTLESRIGINAAFYILKDNIIKNVHSEMRINKIIQLVKRELNHLDTVPTLIQPDIKNRLSEIVAKYASVHRLLSTYKEN